MIMNASLFIFSCWPPVSPGGGCVRAMGIIIQKINALRFMPLHTHTHYTTHALALSPGKASANKPLHWKKKKHTTNSCHCVGKARLLISSRKWDAEKPNTFLATLAPHGPKFRLGGEMENAFDMVCLCAFVSFHLICTRDSFAGNPVKLGLICGRHSFASVYWRHVPSFINLNKAHWQSCGIWWSFIISLQPINHPPGLQSTEEGAGGGGRIQSWFALKLVASSALHWFCIFHSVLEEVC